MLRTIFSGDEPSSLSQFQDESQLRILQKLSDLRNITFKSLDEI